MQYTNLLEDQIADYCRHYGYHRTGIYLGYDDRQRVAKAFERAARYKDSQRGYNRAHTILNVIAMRNGCESPTQNYCLLDNGEIVTRKLPNRDPLFETSTFDRQRGSHHADR